MLFDAGNGDYGLVRDANGLPLSHPVSGDTFTGWVVCLKTNPLDNSVQIDWNNGRAVKARRRYLAPLSIEPIEPGQPISGPWAQPLEEYDV